MTTLINRHDRILSELVSDASCITGMLPTLREMKAASFCQEEVYALLEEVRFAESDRLTEKQNDLLLELMDISAGFCQPSHTIW